MLNTQNQANATLQQMRQEEMARKAALRNWQQRLEELQRQEIAMRQMQNNRLAQLCSRLLPRFQDRQRAMQMQADRLRLERDYLNQAIAKQQHTLAELHGQIGQLDKVARDYQERLTACQDWQARSADLQHKIDRLECRIKSPSLVDRLLQRMRWLSYKVLPQTKEMAEATIQRLKLEQGFLHQSITDCQDKLAELQKHITQCTEQSNPRIRNAVTQIKIPIAADRQTWENLEQSLRCAQRGKAMSVADAAILQRFAGTIHHQLDNPEQIDKDEIKLRVSANRNTWEEFAQALESASKSATVSDIDATTLKTLATQVREQLAPQLHNIVTEQPEQIDQAQEEEPLEQNGKVKIQDVEEIPQKETQESSEMAM